MLFRSPTSGSTGSAKFVKISKKNIVANTKSKKVKKIKRKKPRARTLKKVINNRKKRFKKPIKTRKKLRVKKLKKEIKIEPIKYNKQSLTSKFVRFQLSLKPKFTLKLNLNPEKYIQRFFDKISETISNYKELKKEEKRRIQIEQIESRKSIDARKTKRQIYI